MTNMIQIKKPREDDVLECFLYPQFCYSLNSNEITEEMLLREVDKFNQYIEPFIKDYLWHRDSLTFLIKTKEKLQFENIIDDSCEITDFQLIPHVHILLRFDEDIGDEWFVAFLVFNLTIKYEGLIARMIDSDGDFLLIEAANEIPTWATPEICKNRVFIMNGAVHVFHDKQKNYINILNSVYERSYLFRLSDKVQAVIKKKISIYPEEIKLRIHKARAYLPQKAAYILYKNPRFIAAAIRTICHSDPLERKVCYSMRYFPPEQRIMTNVKMTKCLYAMAMNCRYTGDTRTGWNVPPTSNLKYKSYVLGIIIASGLEILIAQAHEQQKKDKRLLNEATNHNSDVWRTFFQKLNKNGYFHELIEGSREWKKLLDKAKKFYEENIYCREMYTELKGGENVQLFEAYKEIYNNDFEIEETFGEMLSPEDSDSWLNVDPAQFEAILSEQFGVAEKKFDQSNSLQGTVNKFLNQSSCIDGVQFLQYRENPVKFDTVDSRDIDFNPEVFDSTLQDILDFVVPDDADAFDSSPESSVGDNDEDIDGEMENYMHLLDSQMQQNIVINNSTYSVQENLLSSIKEEAGGSGPVGNILGDPVQKMKYLKLESSNNENPKD